MISLYDYFFKEGRWEQKTFTSDIQTQVEMHSAEEKQNK